MTKKPVSDETIDEVGAAAAEGALGLLGLAFPGLGYLARRLTGRVREEWNRNVSTALLAAEAASGMSREDLAAAIDHDPRLVPLTTRLLHAVGMNGHDETLRAMGTALGDAARERSAIDECEIILTALADLTPAHTKVLKLLAGSRDLPLVGGRPGEWTVDFVADRGGLPAQMAGLCLSTLVARGLVESTASWAGGNVYGVTDLGRTVLEVLRQLASTER